MQKFSACRKRGFVDPFLFVDHDAMHQRDLSGRPAEVDAADLQPDQKNSPKLDAGGRVRRRHVMSCGFRRPVVALLGGETQPGE